MVSNGKDLGRLSLKAGADGNSNSLTAAAAAAGGGGGAEASDERHQRLVEKVIKWRRYRARIFGAELFADPAWDLLLELYASHFAGVRVAVTALGVTVIPATTALRWLSRLEKDGLIVRTQDPTDARRVWVDLSELGLRLISDQFEHFPLG
jgi:hypothetical protein